jgi:hypothetical protein
VATTIPTPESDQSQLPTAAFQRHQQRPDDIIAGTAISVTQVAGGKRIDSIVESDQDILPNRVYSPRPVRPDDLAAGANITLTRAAGQVTIAATGGGAAGDSDQTVLPIRNFTQHPVRPDDLVAGNNITLTKAAGQTTIAATLTAAAGDSDQNIIPQQVYRPVTDPIVIVGGDVFGMNWSMTVVGLQGKALPDTKARQYIRKNDGLSGWEAADEAPTKADFDALQGDFDKLLSWIVTTFGVIPTGLEYDFERALATATN